MDNKDFYKFTPRNEDEYLATRVVDQIMWYDKSSIKNKKWFLRLRIIEIAFALCIPFLTAYITSTADPLKILVGIMGVVIGIIAGVIGLMKFQENWIEHRNVAEWLKYERSLFLAKSGSYKNLEDDAAYPFFVENFETIILRSTEKWVGTKSEEETNKIQKSEQ